MLRERFVQHCSRFREMRGMGEGEFPVVPEQVSAVSRYDARTLDALPYEVLEERSVQAMEKQDFFACEVLCAEVDRRNEQAETAPQDLETEERQRWDRLNRDGYPENLGRLDPLTHPAARQTGGSKRDRERRARVEYEAWMESQISRAEAETNGQMLNARGRAKSLRDPRVTARAMWTNHVLASHYASEELRSFWGQPGQERLSFAAFCEQWDGGRGEANERVAKSSLLEV